MPRPVNGLIATHGLSSFCLGLVFPYTAIYLSDLPSVGTPGVAVFYACSGGANLATALLLSTGVLRLRGVPLGVLGTLLWFVGYFALYLAGSYPAVIAAGLAIGVGQGSFLAAIIPIVNSLVTAQERRRVFARRYAVLNGTLALGSLVAAGLTLALPRTVIPYLFLANAVGMLPVTIAILLVRKHLPTVAEERESSATPVGQLWRITLSAAVFQLAVYLFGLSQFEATAPLVSVNLMAMGLSTVSLLLIVDVGVIASCQALITRLLEKRPELFGLRVAMLLWVAGYLCAAVASFGSYPLRLTGLLAYAVLFALGECAYSASFHPWLISLVPDRDLTRANALVNSMMGIGNLAGPSIGVTLALTGSAPTVWLTLAACCAVVTFATARTRRRQAVTA
ncbi:MULTISPECIES: MFS transporter [unclassified Kutzneria]|uniref:MFS transporter n=1 Tax=unclassified Kutzneria TaxID=2621979 RepID=UPI0003EEB516|nr:MFS transporter [Kutzneria sp. 744]EWM18479.1 major facilitator superfamily transporter [Kutzneria sp. 744]